MKFNDTGAVAYYLKCIPWQVKDFSIDKYYKRLEIMNEIIEKDGDIKFILHRFYMIYRKSVKNAPNAQQDVVERVEKGEANPLCGFTTGTPAKPGFLRLQPKKMRQNL